MSRSLPPCWCPHPGPAHSWSRLRWFGADVGSAHCPGAPNTRRGQSCGVWGQGDGEVEGLGTDPPWGDRLQVRTPREVTGWGLWPGLQLLLCVQHAGRRQPWCAGGSSPQGLVGKASREFYSMCQFTGPAWQWGLRPFPLSGGTAWASPSGIPDPWQQLICALLLVLLFPECHVMKS